jgi:hypothetical protein
MQSLDDVKYEEWSRTRLDRLLVDYLLRYGYKESATALAKEKGIEELVDVETFVQMSKIRESLRNGRVTEALAWCNENKKELRRMEVRFSWFIWRKFTDFWQSNLEFMLRFQQYIEMVRTQEEPKLIASIAHAKKFLLPYKDAYPKEIQQVWGLLCFAPGIAPDSYAVCSLIYLLVISNVMLGTLQPIPLERPRQTLHANPQQPALPPARPPPPHRPLRRSLSPQNTLLPLRSPSLLHHIHLSDLLHRAQRPRLAITLRTSYQEPCRERFEVAAEWVCVWEATVGGVWEESGVGGGLV